MPAFYKTPQNYRSAASRTPTPEPFSILNGVALLAEAPADPGDASTPMVVTVNGSPRTRVTMTPGAGQFMVRTATSPQGTAFLPVLEFNAADEGLDGACDYYRTGTVYTSEWFGFFLSFLRPITGFASKATLAATYPASSDYTQPGYPGRMAFLTDNTGWFSDGTDWRQLSGNAQAIIAVDALMAAQFGSAYDAIASHVGALAAGVTAGMTADGSWSPPGTLAGAYQDAVTMAATLDAAFVGAGLTGDLSAAFTSGASLDATWAAGGGAGITRVGVSSVVHLTVGQNSDVTLPGPVLANDIILVYTNCGANTPTGYTLKNSTTQPGSYLFWKRAAGGETTVTVGTGLGGGNGLAVAAVYRGCIASGDPFEVCFFTGTGTGTSATGAPTTTTPKDVVLFGVLFLTSDGSTVPSASWNAPTGATVTTLAQEVNPSPTAVSGQTGIALYDAGIIDPAGSVSLTASFTGALSTKQIKMASFALKPA